MWNTAINWVESSTRTYFVAKSRLLKKNNEKRSSDSKWIRALCRTVSRFVYRHHQINRPTNELFIESRKIKYAPISCCKQNEIPKCLFYRLPFFMTKKICMPLKSMINALRIVNSFHFIHFLSFCLCSNFFIDQIPMYPFQILIDFVISRLSWWKNGVFFVSKFLSN